MLTLTRKQDIKRDESFVAYDICDCEKYEIEALKDAEENNEVVKCEFDDHYIIYAQWVVENNTDEGYWEIDTGDCH
jgi:hypothetical protein